MVLGLREIEDLCKPVFQEEQQLELGGPSSRGGASAPPLLPRMRWLA